jgi:hypothetical protein
MRRSFLIAPLALLVAACASGPTIQSGPDAETTPDGLTRVDNTAFGLVYVRVGADLSTYDKVMIRGAGVEFRPPQPGSREEFPVSEEGKARFVSIMTEAFQEALSRSEVFELVDQPGPDVLLVEGAAVDIVSRVPPRTAGRQDIYLTEVGEATLVLEVSDSRSEGVLVRAADRRIAQDMRGNLQRSSGAYNWSEVRQLANVWSSQLRRGLERLMEAGPLGGEAGSGD